MKNAPFRCALLPLILVGSAIVGGACGTTAQPVENAAPEIVANLTGLHRGHCGRSSVLAFDRFVYELVRKNIVPKECKCIIEPLRLLEHGWANKAPALRPKYTEIATLRKPVLFGGLAVNQIGEEPIRSIILQSTVGGKQGNLFFGFEPRRWPFKKPWPMVYSTLILNSDSLQINEGECRS